MGSKFSQTCLAWFGSLELVCFTALLSAVFFVFNGPDPLTLTQPPYDQYGSAHWVNNGDGTGYLSLTDAVNGQTGVIIFRDCDTGSLITSFSIDLDVRLGGPSNGNPPADGLSVNYAR